MKKLTSNEIRTLWLSFFKEKNHTILPGASLVPQNDPTLLWINSGVAALKAYFDGSKVSSDRRIVNVQKSIRTNDIENVGITNRHHTFFEMLGNFSIGDYFRTEAIEWGFEFLTSSKWLGLPVEKLFFTYHPSDTETRDLWLKCGVNPAHVVPNPDNYWEIGAGPCGPNTEIFFDLGEELDLTNSGVKLLENDIDNDRFLEIWNIVFSQYNAKPGLKREDYEELPSKNIDTGAGLERIASVMQGAPSNFETDLFLPIMSELTKLSNKDYETNKVAFRVISDHLRTTVFALSDGASFSNEGRGYVLRRLLRRAVRYGKKLGLNEPFLFKLVDTVVTIMQDFYPYLAERKTYVKAQIKAEEVRFLNTLAHGEELLRTALKDGKVVIGEVAFKLYDTFGFPLEITTEIAEEVGAKVDVKAFYKLLEAQRERARSARKNIASMTEQSADLLAFATKSLFIEDKTSLKAKALALFKDGKRIKEGDADVSIIFDKTPFYSESGGQVSDVGVISGTNFRANVSAMTKAPHGQHLHHLEILYGTISEGETLTLTIDAKHRAKVVLNHSATHFLHRALNDVLGPEVGQAGSYVGPDYLRFDFNHNERVSPHDVEKIERIVNGYINEHIPLEVKFMTLPEAQKLGAKAQFIDKYGDNVRVVMFSDVSIELCGGTHVSNSSEIGLFVITSEGSVASGIRRIVALTGLAAYEHLKNYQNTLRYVMETAKLSERKEVLPALRNLLSENVELRNHLIKLHISELESLATRIKPHAFNEVNVYFDVLKHKKRDDLAVMSDKIRSIDERAVVILMSENDNENPLLISISKALSKHISANTLMKKLTSEFGGRGGGRPDFANGIIFDIKSAKAIINVVKKELNG